MRGGAAGAKGRSLRAEAELGAGRGNGQRGAQHSGYGKGVARRCGRPRGPGSGSGCAKRLERLQALSLFRAGAAECSREGRASE